MYAERPLDDSPAFSVRFRTSSRIPLESPLRAVCLHGVSHESNRHPPARRRRDVLSGRSRRTARDDRRVPEGAPRPAARSPRPSSPRTRATSTRGPIAASAYAPLAPARGKIKRVVLLGPSHRVPFRGLAATSARRVRHAARRGPDRPRGDRADRGPAAGPGPRRRPTRMEHSLEVQLPFLQEVLGDFSLVPLAVGEATPEEVGEVLEKLWGGPETLIVISSDLSHYHDYKTARQHGRGDVRGHRVPEARRRSTTTRPAAGSPSPACSWRRRSTACKAKTIDLRSSGDTAGPRDEVVGYGAYVFE